MGQEQAGKVEREGAELSFERGGAQKQNRKTTAFAKTRK
jgi:hypothetical protein